MRFDTKAAMHGWALAALFALAPRAAVAVEAPKPAAKAEPAKAAAAPGEAGETPEVKKLVDAMQSFYEKAGGTSRPTFEQTYHYATFKRVQKSSRRDASSRP